MKNLRKFIQFTFLIISLIMLGIACQNINSDKTKGTIGKVDKFHIDQMSENDLKLRSEIIEDTARLKKVIRGLMVHHAYISSLSLSLEEYINTYSGTVAANELDEDLEKLKEFREYLNNSNNELQHTIYMFADIYSDTVTKSSFDVGQNLRNYMNIFSTLKMKDEIMLKIVESTDQWLKDNKNNFSPEELEDIKNVRDKILVKNMQMACVMNDRQSLNSVMFAVLFNSENLNVAVGDLSGQSSVDAVYSVQSNEELGVFIISNAFKGIGSVEVPQAMEDIADAAVTQANEDLNSFFATGNIGSFIKGISTIQALEQLGSKVKAGETLSSAEEAMQALSELAAVQNIGSQVINSHEIFSGIESLQSSEGFKMNMLPDISGLHNITQNIADLHAFNQELSGNEVLNEIRPL